jgi:hypothetical protein
MVKVGSSKIIRNSVNVKSTAIKPIKTLQTLKAQKSISQIIDEDINRNIDVYIRLCDR